MGILKNMGSISYMQPYKHTILEEE